MDTRILCDIENLIPHGMDKPEHHFENLDMEMGIIIHHVPLPHLYEAGFPNDIKHSLLTALNAKM